MIVLVIAVAAFVSGAVAGVIGLLCVGISREEAGRSMTSQTHSRPAAATRRLTGLHVRKLDDEPAANEPEQDPRAPWPYR